MWLEDYSLTLLRIQLGLHPPFITKLLITHLLKKFTIISISDAPIKQDNIYQWCINSTKPLLECIQCQNNRSTQNTDHNTDSRCTEQLTITNSSYIMQSLSWIQKKGEKLEDSHNGAFDFSQKKEEQLDINW